MINGKILGIYIDFLHSVDTKQNKNNEDFKKWADLFEKVASEIQPAIEELEDEFRKLLGENH